MQLLSIHCYELDDEKGSNYDLYKSYIEKYSFLEHITFVDSDRKVLFPILCVFNYYLENAFDKNIWIKSNSIIKKVYRSKSNDICTPFLDLFLRKRINCSLTESNLYLKANKEKNCYEFNFHSKKFETYKSFCLFANLSNERNLFFDDHICASVEVKCAKNLFHLYLEIKYSNDFIDYDLNHSEVILRLYFNNDDLKLVVKQPRNIIVEKNEDFI